jgi:TonB-dependent receptor
MKPLSQRIAATRLAFAFVFLLTVLGLRAQSTAGAITGSLVDASTGKYLEGAEITLDGGSDHIASARDGRFAFNNVPAGPHTVTVSYPGFDVVTRDVTVTAGQTADLPIQLGGGTGIVKLSEYKVAGTKEGMAQAIALQRASDNIKVVAASDQFGDIAEGNAAEYIKFLPGVGIDYNANDARAATLRGMSTAFTNVTMNGNPIASATSGNLNRRFEFEQVAINNIETIEVYKTLTPDMQATSTGGSINLVTKSAFDRAGSLFTYRAYLQAAGTDLYLHKSEGWGQEQTHKILPGVDLNYATRLRDDLGINVSYKNSQLFNNYPRSSYSWQYNPANGGLPNMPWLSNWNLQNEQKNTRRQSLSGQVDYKLGPDTKLSVVGSWNFYDLLFTDRTTTITPGNPAALSTTSTVSYGRGVYNGPAGKGSAQFQTINRWKSGVTWEGTANAEHAFGNGAKLLGSGYWSQAYSKYRDTTGGWYSDATIQKTGLTVNFADVGEIAPTYTVLNGTTPFDLRDVTQYALSQVRSRPQTGVDTKYGASLDFHEPLATAIPITVKVGGRIDYTTRTIDSRVFNAPAAALASVGGQKLATLVDTGFSQHPIGYGRPAYNFLSVYSAYENLGGMNFLTYAPASTTAAFFNDTTPAAYARLDIKPISQVLVVAGVRYEDRTTDVENRQPNLPEIIHGKFTDRSWFPSINLKYDVTRNFELRFGAAKSIGLPDYSDLLPGRPTVVDPTSTARGRVSIFNPNLKPYTVDNYDFTAEYYFNRSGFVSASLFYKNFKNAIVDATQTLDASLVSQLGIPSTSLGFPLDQYDVGYKFNVPDQGHYKGIELNGQQNLTFLPKPFNTLVIQANATFLGVDPIKSNAVFSNNPADPNLNAAILQTVNKSMEIAAVKRAFNVSLNYTIGKFGFTVTSNYTGYVLKGANRQTVKYSDEKFNRYTFEYQYQAPRELVDLRIDYRWNRKFTPYLEVRNVFGRPIITTSNLMPINHAEYGDPIYELGVRGVW